MTTSREAATTREPDPRIERTRRAVLDSALALLIERGIRRGDDRGRGGPLRGRQVTIYRHWPGRVELIHDAFHELKPTMPVPTEGCVRDRLVACSSTWPATSLRRSGRRACRR